MKKLAICLVAAFAVMAFGPAALTPGHSLRAEAHSAANLDLRAGMRALWEEHIVYTRNYIISALAGLPDTDAVAKRLFAN